MASKVYKNKKNKQLYRVVGPTKIKRTIDRKWVEGLNYVRLDDPCGQSHTREVDDFLDRFVRVDGHLTP